MRARLGRCMILDARFVNHTPKPSLTVSWRIVGNPYLGIISGVARHATRIGTPNGGCIARESLSGLSLPHLNDTSERFRSWIESVSILVNSWVFQDNGSGLPLQEVLRFYAGAFHEKLVGYIVNIDPAHRGSRWHDEAGWVDGEAHHRCNHRALRNGCWVGFDSFPSHREVGFHVVEPFMRLVARHADLSCRGPRVKLAVCCEG